MFNREGNNKKVTNIETINPKSHHPSKINNWFYTTKN